MLDGKASRIGWEAFEMSAGGIITTGTVISPSADLSVWPEARNWQWQWRKVLTTLISHFDIFGYFVFVDVYVRYWLLAAFRRRHGGADASTSKDSIGSHSMKPRPCGVHSCRLTGLTRPRAFHDRWSPRRWASMHMCGRATRARFESRDESRESCVPLSAFARGENVLHRADRARYLAIATLKAFKNVRLRCGRLAKATTKNMAQKMHWEYSPLLCAYRFVRRLNLG